MLDAAVGERRLYHSGRGNAAVGKRRLYHSGRGDVFLTRGWMRSSGHLQKDRRNLQLSGSQPSPGCVQSLCHGFPQPQNYLVATS